jgi:hypothetical protein
MLVNLLILQEVGNFMAVWLVLTSQDGIPATYSHFFCFLAVNMAQAQTVLDPWRSLISALQVSVAICTISSAN